MKVIVRTGVGKEGKTSWEMAQEGGERDKEAVEWEVECERIVLGRVEGKCRAGERDKACEGRGEGGLFGSAKRKRGVGGEKVGQEKERGARVNWKSQGRSAENRRAENMVGAPESRSDSGAVGK